MGRLAGSAVMLWCAAACRGEPAPRVLSARLPAAAGVAVGQAVYLHGLPVGEVRGVEPAGGDSGAVRVTIAVTRPDAPLTRGAGVRLTVPPSAALVPLARARLEVVPGGADAAPLASGDTLAALPPLRLDSAAQAVIRAAPGAYRRAKEVRDALAKKAP